jgi:hypothetical protein
MLRIVCKRRITLPYLLFIICTFFCASCATTTVTDVWKDKDYQGKAQKIVVIMAARSPDMRNMFEDRFVGELDARGNNAFQSHTIIPMEQLRDKELVKSKIKSTGADTVLISRLVDTKTIESYMPGQIYVVPSFYYGWGSYYDILFVGYGYTDDIQVAYIETNLYDVKTEKLIWSTHSKTERTEGEQQLINTFINIIIKKLSSAGIIK